MKSELTKEALFRYNYFQTIAYLYGMMEVGLAAKIFSALYDDDLFNETAVRIGKDTIEDIEDTDINVDLDNLSEAVLNEEDQDEFSSLTCFYFAKVDGEEYVVNKFFDMPCVRWLQFLHKDMDRYIPRVDDPMFSKEKLCSHNCFINFPVDGYEDLKNYIEFHYDIPNDEITVSNIAALAASFQYFVPYPITVNETAYAVQDAINEYTVCDIAEDVELIRLIEKVYRDSRSWRYNGYTPKEIK